METLISVSRALELINQHVKTLTPKYEKIENANGLISAEEIFSPINIPSFSQSSMDGYAFAFQENVIEYHLKGEISAGSKEVISLKSGEAVRIFTGAALPANTDTVLMQEKAEVNGNILKVLDEKLKKGTNVRAIGSEITKGILALENNTQINAATIGFLASMGIQKVLVYPNPNVGILVTGNELQTLGNPLDYGQIYDSNSYTLMAALNQIGVKKIKVYRSKDNLEELHQVLKQLTEENDLILISGGVSVGDYDFTMQAFEQVGIQKIFHKIKQKPGKPLLFGTLADKVVFGLPGNPASVLTCFYEYVLQAIGIMTKRNLNLKTEKLKVLNFYQKQNDFTHFLKAYKNEDSVNLLTGQESYKLNSFAQANCLAIIPSEILDISAGDEVEVHIFPM